MQRYFVNDKNEDIFTLTNDDSHHVINVMRMNNNDKVEIVYDNNLYIASIISFVIFSLSSPVKALCLPNN